MFVALNLYLFMLNVKYHRWHKAYSFYLYCWFRCITQNWSTGTYEKWRIFQILSKMTYNTLLWIQGPSFQCYLVVIQMSIGFVYNMHIHISSKRAYIFEVFAHLEIYSFIYFPFSIHWPPLIQPESTCHRILLSVTFICLNILYIDMVNISHKSHKSGIFPGFNNSKVILVWGQRLSSWPPKWVHLSSQGLIFCQ